MCLLALLYRVAHDAPIVVGAIGILIERNFIAQLGSKDRTRSFVFLGVAAISFLILFAITFQLAELAAGVRSQCETVRTVVR